MTGDGADAAGAPEDAADALGGTIWPEVDACLAGVSCEPQRGAADLIVVIPRDELLRGLRALRSRDGLAFDYLRCLCGVDREDEGIEVVYHLYSSARRLNLTVKTRLPNDDLSVGTATGVWRAADWLERETAEMFGVRFEGHPDPRPLLLPEDMDDTFPLRKEHPLAEIEVLQGEGVAYGEGVLP